MASLLNRVSKKDSFLRDKLREFNNASMEKVAESKEEKEVPEVETKTGLGPKKEDPKKVTETIMPNTEDPTAKELAKVLEDVMTIEAELSDNSNQGTQETPAESKAENEADKMEPGDSKKEDKDEEKPIELKASDEEDDKEEMDKESSCGSKSKHKKYSESTKDLVTAIMHYEHIPNPTISKYAEESSVVAELLMIDKI